MALETELKYFNEHKPELLKHHAGKFVLIVGDKLIGAYDRSEDAYAAGIERFGNVPMLIKRVESEERKESLPAMTLGLIGARLT